MLNGTPPERRTPLDSYPGDAPLPKPFAMDEARPGSAPSVSLPAQVLQALERGAAVVTANQRSARSLRIAYARSRRGEGQAIWTPAAILSWSAWTRSLWQRLLLDGGEERLLLSPAQEHLVWTAIIEADQELASLRRPDALAELAQRAWASLAASRGLGRLRECEGSLDAETFRRWAIDFDGRCKRGQWISASQLDQALADHLDASTLAPAEPEIALVGFDRLTPAQAALGEALRSAGIPCSPLALAAEAPTPQLQRRVLIEAESGEEEASAAAWNARRILEANPSARIAVILPDAAARRSELERAFRSVLSPQFAGIETADDQLPFEFSLGKPLALLPMTSAALALLRWLDRPLPYDEASRLLVSPYLGESGDLNARAALDERLRRKSPILQPEASLEWLIGMMGSRPRLAPFRQSLASALRVAREARLQAPSRAAKTHSEWAATMREALAGAKWPGARSLSSGEFQLLRKWDALLDELAMLDFANLEISGGAKAARWEPSQRAPQVEFSSALHSLERLAAQTLFAPESSDAPVQIMGTLEAAGSLFDAVLFLGATDAAWPAPQQSAPFLPWRLQAALRMPNTDADADHRHAASVAARIAASAPAVFFSHAKRDGKIELRPSPLLKEFATQTAPPCGPHSAAATIPIERAAAQACIPDEGRSALPNIQLEEFDGEGAIAPLPDAPSHGGAQLLKLQSLCPFRAFAELRLGSSELATIEPGLNAMQRGSIVHEALHQFWKKTLTQDRLRAMGAEERAETLRSAATAAIEKVVHPATAWDRAYLSLQGIWLADLMDRWLTAELDRPEFEVLSSERERTQAAIGPLRLTLRPDRVDAVNGGLLYLDYKTGACSPNDWNGGRPGEPQLPLYATLSDPALLAGLAFAKVSAGEMCLSGYAASPGVLKPAKFKANGDPAFAREVRPNLIEEVAEWKRVLEALAEEFHRGVATVTPKSYPKTCERCGQGGFCRVSESRAVLETGMFDEDESEGSSEAGSSGAAEDANG